MRVGLVLGAGGVLGASWLIGALEAIEAETGWRAGDAQHIVGTSAGSVIGALAAAGVAPYEMNAYASGSPLDALENAERAAADASRRVTGSEYRLEWALPPLGPGSWRLAATTMLRPHRHAPPTILAGWLPRGFISTAPIRELIEAFVPGDWPDHPSYWAVAADYATGGRVAFGRDGAPTARVAEAVAASCAIPGFYYPVTIDGRRYVDGGICSTSNLDLVRDAQLDLVLCLNPMSSLAQLTGGSPADRFAAAMRAMAGRRLGHEAKKVRAAGAEVVVIQPGSEDCALMGLNLMNGARRIEVMQQARKSVTRELRERPLPLPATPPAPPAARRAA
jgi:NTE family protein